MIRYWIDDNFIRFEDENSSGMFTENDREGYYQKYLTWLAQGNTPEEWTNGL